MNKENSKWEGVKRMIPLVFGQRLFDDAERLKFLQCVAENNCSFGVFLSQTGSFMSLSDPQTLETGLKQFLNYFEDKVSIPHSWKNNLGFHPMTGEDLPLPPHCTTAAPNIPNSLLLAC